MIPQIAVLTPVYKHAEYLPAMLRTLIAQTFVSWECAVVFDGPDRHFEQIQEEFAAEHRIRFLMLPEHVGLPTARNRCASETTAPWVLPFDADDLMDAEYLETLWDAQRTFEAMRSPEKYRAYFTPAILLYENGGTAEYVYPPYIRDDVAEEVFLPGSSMFRRTLYEKYQGLDPAWNIGATDWMFWIRVAADRLLEPVQTLTPKWIYRQHQGYRSHHEGVRQFARLKPEMQRALRGERQYGEAIP